MDHSITVVCPTYNSSQYIEKTLDALIKQVEYADEIIFSDDGSSDSTIEVLEKWKVAFESVGILVVIIKNKHKGPGATRNIAIQAARFNWISFLDADDLWRPEKILKVKEVMDRYPEKNIFLHSEEYVRLNGTRSVLMHGKNYRDDISLSQQLYRACFFSTSALTLHKTVLQQGLFDPTLPNGQDYELWLRLSPFMRLKIIPDILGEYIEQPHSITARPYYRRYFSQIRILLRHYKKGGFFLAMYMIIRATISRQWLGVVYNIFMGSNRHA